MIRSEVVAPISALMISLLTACPPEETSTSAPDAAVGTPGDGGASDIEDITLSAFTRTSTGARDLDIPIKLTVLAEVRGGSPVDLTSQVEWEIDPATHAHVRGVLLEGDQPGDVTVRARFRDLTSDALAFTFERRPRHLLRYEVTPSSRILARGAMTTELHAAAVYSDQSREDIGARVRWRLEAMPAAVPAPSATATITFDAALGDVRFTATAPGLWYAIATTTITASNRVPILVAGPNDRDIAEATIAPSGGALVVAGMTITVPDGAFATPTKITAARVDAKRIAQLETFTPIGDAYLIDSESETNKPVTVRLPLPENALAAGEELSFAVNHGDGWEIDGEPRIEGGFVEHEQTRFSEEQLVKAPAVVPDYWVIDGVPYFLQDQDGWCFATSAAINLGYFGRNLRRWSIAGDRRMKPTDGIPYLDDALAPYTAKTERISFGNIPDLRRYIARNVAAGRPVIISSAALEHAITIVGYDVDNYYINDSGPIVRRGVSRAYVQVPKYEVLFAVTGVLDTSTNVLIGGTPSPRSATSDIYRVNGGNLDWRAELQFDGQKSPRGYYYKGEQNFALARDTTFEAAMPSGPITVLVRGWKVSSSAPAQIPLRLSVRDRRGTRPDRPAKFETSYVFSNLDPGDEFSQMITIPTSAQNTWSEGVHDVSITTGEGAMQDNFEFSFEYQPTVSFRGTALFVDPVTQQLRPLARQPVTITGTVDRHGRAIEVMTNSAGFFEINHVRVSERLDQEITFRVRSPSGTLKIHRIRRTDFQLGQVYDVGEIVVSERQALFSYTVSNHARAAWTCPLSLGGPFSSVTYESSAIDCPTNAMSCLPDADVTCPLLGVGESCVLTIGLPGVHSGGTIGAVITRETTHDWRAEIDVSLMSSVPPPSMMPNAGCGSPLEPYLESSVGAHVSAAILTDLRGRHRLDVHVTGHLDSRGRCNSPLYATRTTYTTNVIDWETTPLGCNTEASADPLDPELERPIDVDCRSSATIRGSIPIKLDVSLAAESSALRSYVESTNMVDTCVRPNASNITVQMHLEPL